MVEHQVPYWLSSQTFKGLQPDKWIDQAVSQLITVSNLDNHELKFILAVDILEAVCKQYVDNTPDYEQKLVEYAQQIASKEGNWYVKQGNAAFELSRKKFSLIMAAVQKSRKQSKILRT